MCATGNGKGSFPCFKAPYRRHTHTHHRANVTLKTSDIHAMLSDVCVCVCVCVAGSISACHKNNYPSPTPTPKKPEPYLHKTAGFVPACLALIFFTSPPFERENAHSFWELKREEKPASIHTHTGRKSFRRYGKNTSNRQHRWTLVGVFVESSI